jgi:hypothetical protein
MSTIIIKHHIEKWLKKYPSHRYEKNLKMIYDIHTKIRNECSYRIINFDGAVCNHPDGYVSGCYAEECPVIKSIFKRNKK